MANKLSAADWVGVALCAWPKACRDARMRELAGSKPPVRGKSQEPQEMRTNKSENKVGVMGPVPPSRPRSLLPTPLLVSLPHPLIPQPCLPGWRRRYAAAGADAEDRCRERSCSG